MSAGHIYKAFGLTFYSEFEIPEFERSDGTAQIQIKRGKAPDQIAQIKRKGVLYQSAKNEFLLEVDCIARFYVKDGNEIIVDSSKLEIDKEVRLFLLGSALGALFIQRGLLPIHGSALKLGNEATIFTGQSGVGKSTIAAHFMQKGIKVLSDDICLINDSLKVQPAFPKMKLWEDSALKLNIETNSLSKVRDNLDKYHLSLSDLYCNQALDPSRIIIIQTKNSEGFEIEELTGVKKFNAVKNNTYRYKFVEGLEMQQDHFKILNELLTKVKVYRVSRPQSPFLIKEFADFLMKSLEIDA